MLPGDTIPLWDMSKEVDQLAFEVVTPQVRDPNCGKCGAHEHIGEGLRCIKPGLVPGMEDKALLVVGAWPTVYESEKGEPFLGAYGRRIRQVVKDNWDGHVVFDYALRCPARDMKPAAGWYQQCRPYLARTAQFYNYERVVLLGREACRAFLGRPIDVDSVERPWAWSTSLDAPVFATLGVKAASYNTLNERTLYESLRWACTTPRPPRPPFEQAVGRRIAMELEGALWAWAEPVDELVLDIETEGRIYDDDFRIVSAAVGREGSNLVWLWAADDLVPGTPACELFCELMLAKLVTAHNRQFEAQCLRRAYGITLRTGGVCTMLGYKLLKGNAFVSLEGLQDVIGMGGSKDELTPYLAEARSEIRREAEADAIASPDPVSARKRDPRVDNPDQFAYGRIPIKPLATYNGRDTFTSVHLRAWEKQELATRYEGVMQDVWDEDVGPLHEVVAYMERTGFRAERNHARELQRYFGARIERLSLELNDWANINWASGAQIATFLYDELQLPVPWRTEKGAPSVDKYALGKLKSLHPCVQLLLEKRQAETLNKTYCWGIERYIQGDGRVHTHIKIHGSETGRPQSSEPNQQNMPKAKTPDGKLVKDLYLASEGRELVTFDHATLEIRISAGLAQDDEMFRVIKSGENFHLATARIIAGFFGVDPAEVHKEHWLYDTAKTINFALLYGKSDYSAAEDLDIEIEKASKTREAILGNFRKLSGWIDGQHQLVRDIGGVWVFRPGMVPGRFRPLPKIYSRSRAEVGNALRAAVNTPVQGGGAMVNNAGLVACYKWLHETRVGRKRMADFVSMPLAVHDQIIFDADKHAVEDVLANVPRLMTSFDVGVPLAVDAARGERLGSCEKVDLA